MHIAPFPVGLLSPTYRLYYIVQLYDYLIRLSNAENLIGILWHVQLYDYLIRLSNGSVVFMAMPDVQLYDLFIRQVQISVRKNGLAKP